MQYLNDLNPQQKEAVLTSEGPMMLLAGAGSGKTKTIISKILHLIQTKNVKPWEILAVTFSNRAANEMKQRIFKSLPDIAPSSLNLSTFHAFCTKVLRYNSTLIGLKSSFSIYDDSESLAVARAICKKHALDSKKNPPSALTHYIDQIKNTGFYKGRHIPLKKDLAENELYPYYLEFEAELQKNNAVDFGSLIVKVLELLENHPQVLDYYNNKYKYLLVDEYQDTNRAQFDLICLLAKKHQNICVVGDSDQCVLPNTLIEHSSGFTPADSLNLSQKVLSFSQQLEPSCISKISKTPYEGKVITITLDTGESLTTTPSHIHFTKKPAKPLELDDCKITYLGGNGKHHKLEFFNYSKESSDLEELYSFYQGVANSLDLKLIEEIIINNQAYSLTMAGDVKVGDTVPTKNGEGVITDISSHHYKGIVVDIDVPLSHNYLANGIFTHNSIYSWRGAEIRNILDFEKSFPTAKILKLEENYRSSKNIIEAASEMIKKNIFRKDKNMFTSNDLGEKIKVYACQDGETESLFVAQSINKLLKDKVSPKEIAVFYRTNSQSRTLEDSLRRYKIPYNIIGGLKFYERREVKDVIAYLQCMANPFDTISFLRIINTPARGLGEKSVEKLKNEADKRGLTLFEYLEQGLKTSPSSLGSAKAVAGLREVVGIITKGKQMVLDGKEPDEMFDLIINETSYMKILKASGKYEDQARVDNLQELKSSIVQFINFSEDKTLGSYLETITLDRSEDNLDYGKVSLMTIHASKGLEFDHVFIVGVEESIFPSAQSLGDGRERLEEERRLFYVACTRARKNLSILFATRRMLYGKTVFNPPSRFVDELPRKYLTKYKV